MLVNEIHGIVVANGEVVIDCEMPLFLNEQTLVMKVELAEQLVSDLKRLLEEHTEPPEPR